MSDPQEPQEDVTDAFLRFISKKKEDAGLGDDPEFAALYQKMLEEERRRFFG